MGSRVGDRAGPPYERGGDARRLALEGGVGVNFRKFDLVKGFPDKNASIFRRQGVV